MKSPALSALLFTLTLAVVTPAARAADEPAKPDAAASARLVNAIVKSDYAAFIADGEPAFQQMKQEQFAAVAAKLGPKLAAGHQVTYLGDMRKGGYHVTLWRISFQDGSDDVLATLSMKDGKVGGFFLR